MPRMTDAACTRTIQITALRLSTLAYLLLHWCGARFTLMRDNMVEMSLATLDLTHVLCECPASCLKTRLMMAM